MSQVKQVEETEKTDISKLLKSNKEYTNHMIRLIQPEIYSTFQKIYNDIKKSSKTQTGILIPFQNSVAEIPKWSPDTLNEKVQEIKKSSDCDWLDNLVEAVFSTNNKISNAIEENENSNIPDVNQFIHIYRLFRFN